MIVFWYPDVVRDFIEKAGSVSLFTTVRLHPSDYADIRHFGCEVLDVPSLGRGGVSMSGYFFVPGDEYPRGLLLAYDQGGDVVAHRSRHDPDVHTGSHIGCRGCLVSEIMRA